MIVLKSCCALLASCCMLSAMACDSPTVVVVPDGATATTEELIEAQTQVRAYMAAMEEYLACLDQEMEAAGGERAPADFRAAMVTRYNTAVEEMESVAATFNTQVAAHRAATSGD